MTKRTYKVRVQVREDKPRRKGGQRLGFDLRLDVAASDFREVARVVDEKIQAAAAAMDVSREPKESDDA